MIIAVIGGEQALPDACELAEAVGREIAGQGALLICGGGGGVMEAACRGAQAAGGTTIGVLPGADKDAANAFVDIPIVTGMGHARNVVIILSADAVIAIDGSFGTLSEMAYALNYRKPLVGLKTWSMTHDGAPAVFEVVDEPVEAVRLAVSLVEKQQSGATSNAR